MTAPAKFGLTGGIASGKSSVARLLRESGVAVIDADALYHRLIAPLAEGPSPLAEAIAKAFGTGLLPGGALDRQALGRVVFNDPKARLKLEEMTHPPIRQAFEDEAHALFLRGHRFLFYDVPLLFERGMQDQFAGVVLVWVPRNTQIMRLMRRDNLDHPSALTRLDAQLPLEDKMALATWVIDNSQDLSTTARQVKSLVDQLTPSSSHPHGRAE